MIHPIMKTEVIIMKDINLSLKIVSKRKEKAITQDELADFLGVSKASISKWETGKNYPDITLLPQITIFFNLTIDELIGYEPQMIKKNIRILYQSLANDFTLKPIDEVIEHCNEITKKYYSCFPLLLQIGILLLNYASQIDATDKKTTMITRAKDLFIRVKNESEDLELINQALSMEAVCALTLGEVEEVLELLRNTNKIIMSTEGLLSSAYQMLNQEMEAKKILQIGIYQHVIALLNMLPSYLTLCIDDRKRYEETNKRILLFSEIFKLKTLQPTALMTIYIVSAQGYVTQGKKDKALSMLEKYTTLVTDTIHPIQLRGDDFFDFLDPWLDELILGTAPPRDEKSIEISIVDSITKNPIFASLENESRFTNIVKRLQKKF